MLLLILIATILYDVQRSKKEDDFLYALEKVGGKKNTQCLLSWEY